MRHKAKEYLRKQSKNKQDLKQGNTHKKTIIIWKEDYRAQKKN